MIPDSVLALGATMRLTRLIVTDDIGQWWVKDPLDTWVHEGGARIVGTDGKVTALGKRRLLYHKYLAGLECGHCTAVWAAAAVLLGRAVLPRPLWRWGAGVLTTAHLAAHIGERIGDAGYADDEDEQGEQQTARVAP